MDKVQLIILAGGKGTRMRSEEPKALAMFKGKPFIRHILDNVGPLNFTIKPIIVVGHKKEMVIEYLGPDYLYCEQKEQRGTGDAVRSAVETIDKTSNTVVVIFVDQLMVSKETVGKVIATHIEKRPAITMATITVPDFEDWRVGMNHYGRIIRGENNLINGIVEFKDATEAERQIKEVNPSIYAFDKEWLVENIDKLQSDNAQNEYYLTDLVKIAREQNKTIEQVPVTNLIEGLHPNSKEELEILERLLEKA